MLNRFISTALALACLLLAIALFRHDNNPPAIRSSSTVLLPADFSPAAAQALLDTPLAKVDLENVTLEDAIFSLAAMSKANICGEWQTLEDAGMTRMSRVRIHLQNVTLGQALDAVLKSLAQHDQFPACYVNHGIIIVSTLANGSRHTVTEFVNTRPLVEELRAYYRSIEPPDGGLPLPRERIGPPPMEVIDFVVKLITDFVAPDSWRDSGGTVGSLRELGGVLIITQTPENILAIRKLLAHFHEVMQTSDLFPIADGRTKTAPRTPPAEEAGRATTQPTIGYFNIRLLATELQRGPGWKHASGDDQSPIIASEAINGIINMLMETIDPDSWHQTSGMGIIYCVGGILAVKQTPANIEAVGRALEGLHRAVNSPDFPAMRPAPATHPTTTATQPVTEFINIRRLVEELRIGSGWNDIKRADQFVQDPSEVIEDITKAIEEIVEPETWRDAGGTIGSLHETGGIVSITHTASNVIAVRDLLEKLHRATGADDVPPTTQPAFLTKNTELATPQSVPDRYGTITACFNIRPIMIALGAGRPTYTPMGNDRGLSTWNAAWIIKNGIATHVAPDSWQDTGGTIGRLQEIGGILVVTHTPKNIEAVGAELEAIRRRIAKHEFPTSKSTGRNDVEEEPGHNLGRRVAGLGQRE